MKLSEITDDKAFVAFLYAMFLSRLGIDGQEDDYFSIEISNELFHSYIRTTIKKVPTEEDKLAMDYYLGIDVDKWLEDFKAITPMDDSDKYQNWHTQVYASKDRYEKDIQRCDEKIQEFFDGHADMIEFDVDQDVVKVRGRYEHPIPPKLLMEFCDKFGYYSPTLNQDWIKTSVFSHVHYRFSKKDCRIHKEV